jgi:hypothetical protein
MAYVLRNFSCKSAGSRELGHEELSETNHFNSDGGWTRNVGLGVLVRLG